MNFKDIAIKEIGKLTNFKRTTIYNYFQTKEEIFLSLYTREYDKWNEVLEEILSSNETLTLQALAEEIAQTLVEREQLLKLISMNNFDMEASSCIEDHNV